MTRDHEADHGGHERVLELLPWYLNATLGADEQGEVERGLATCPACRAELARCRTLGAAVRAEAERRGAESWAPSRHHLAGVLARIDAAERRPRTPFALHRLSAWIRDTPPPVRWVLAAQGVAVLALVAALVGRRPAPASYETLSRHGLAVGAERALVHVVLAEDATERRIRDLLLGVGGAVVEGPTPRGVYTVALPFAPSDRARLEATVARLRAEPVVRFVAPAPGRSP